MGDTIEAIKRKPGRPRKAVAPPETIPSIPSEGEKPREEGLQSIRESQAVSLQGVKKPTSPAAPEPKKSTLPDSVLALNPKHRAFVLNYADPESKTYSNGVQSAISAGVGGTYMSAGQSATDLLKTGRIRNAINDLLEDNGLGSKDRSRIIGELAKQRTAEILHYDGDGRLTQRQVIDNGKLRLQAVREASRLAGDYARAESVAKAQRDAVQPLVAHYAKQLREAIKAEERLSLSPHSTTVEPTSDTEGTTVLDIGYAEGDAVEGTQESVEPTLPEGTTKVDGGAGV